MSMSSTIVGPRRVQVWQADAEWPDNAFVVPAEDHDEVLVDREVKASNLEKLIDMVLAMDAAGEAFEQNVDAAKEDTLGDAWQAASEAVVALARGLKQ